jgi:hypothetical protein
LVRYINEAQRRFAKRAFVIRDSRTPEVVNITIEAGVVDYDLHQSIISVLSARVVGSTVDLVRVGHAALGTYATTNATIIPPESFAQASPASPRAFQTDETLVEDDDGTIATTSMRIYPTPRTEDAGTIIQMRTIRMPLDELTESNLVAVPEVPADHHLEMLDWAAYLALRIADVDAGNQKLAQSYAQSFEAHVQEARKLILNKLYAPQRWGFGRGGWGGYSRDG